MLALMVVAFTVIDVLILLIYTIMEGARGNLGAELQQNVREEVDVSFFNCSRAITIQSFLNYTALIILTIA